MKIFYKFTIVIVLLLTLTLISAMDKYNKKIKLKEITVQWVILENEIEFTLNAKVDQIRIRYDFPLFDKKILDQVSSNHSSSYFDMATNDVERVLIRINDHFETKGYSFANIHLSNLQLIDQRLSADLNIEISEKRSIDKIIIKDTL